MVQKKQLNEWVEVLVLALERPVVVGIKASILVQGATIKLALKVDKCPFNADCQNLVLQIKSSKQQFSKASILKEFISIILVKQKFKD